MRRMCCELPNDRFTRREADVQCSAFTLNLNGQPAFENNDGLTLNLQLALLQFNVHETGSL